MRRKRISLRQELPLLLWLVFVWGALWQDFSIGNLAFGALIALAVARLFYLPPVELGGRFNIFRALVFAPVFLARVVAASLEVFWLALFRGSDISNAVIAVPLRSHSDLMITATGHVISLIPGSLVVEVDRSTPTLYVHALNVADGAAVAQVRHEVRNAEAWLIRIMGSREELAALRAEAAAAAAEVRS
ncbi:MAG: Na+/H+ antiporter subunit E [Actinomycetota bacterium]|nr:Na+/H+ antiporter subunit E [Actinomycetota bacterium]